MTEGKDLPEGMSTDDHIFDRGSPKDVRRMMSKALLRVQLYALLAAADVLAIVIGIAVAAILRLGTPFDASVQEMLLGLVPLYLLLGFYNQAFSLQCLERRTLSVRRALSTLALTVAVVLGVGYALKISSDYSRLVLIIGLAGSAFLTIIFRLLIDRAGRVLLRGGVVEHLVLCDGAMFLPKHGERVINARAMGLHPRLDSPQMLDRLGQIFGQADRVVIACEPASRAAWAAATKGLGVSVEVLIPEVEELGVLSTDSYDGRLTAIIGRGPLSTSDKIIKRMFDLLLLLAVLPVFLIVVGVVALLIKFDDGGPIFFKQKRIGQGNRLFDMYKFRSMQLERSDSDGRVSASRGDERVTRLGRFLRKTSIDELPQLFNVLKGDMSVVGPRPHALASTAGNELFWEIDNRYWVRHAAKPGLTGLAQVRGFRGATANAGDLISRVQSDLEYLSGWSLWRDVKIVAATLKVIWHPNAY
ncbi:MAG: exopolysaccharide biosynthesis polyprenyl glycosylphosphotransferase [Pseudomonadota bacterium]